MVKFGIDKRIIGWDPTRDPEFTSAESARHKAHVDLSRKVINWVNSVTQTSWAKAHATNDNQVDLVFMPSYANPYGSLYKALPDGVTLDVSEQINDRTDELIGYCYTFRCGDKAKLMIGYRWDESKTGPHEQDLSGSIDVRVVHSGGGRKWSETKHYGVR